MLNSVCKINSPGAGVVHIRLPLTSCPLFFSYLLPSCSFSNSSNQVFLLSSLFYTIHALYLTSLPIHLKNITELTGYIVVVSMVARGPAGGHCVLGTGSDLTGQRLGLGVMGVVGTVLRERVCVSAHYVTWPVLGPISFLSLCHPIPSCNNKARLYRVKILFQMTCNSDKYLD